MTAMRRILAMLCLLVALSPARAEDLHRPGELIVESVSLRTPQGEMISYDRGTLYVPENRQNPASRVIGVGFARFRAIAPTGAPPTFHLPGGPGQTFLEWLDPASPRFARLVSDIALYRRVGDMVFVDQRGFSARGDMLKFKYRTEPLPLNQPGSLAAETAAYVAMSRAAAAESSRRGVDLRGYTVKECAADVDELRRALGYDQITLIGQSFGSQWSAAVMRLYPHSVARAILSGVEPLDYSYDMPSHVLAAVQRQWRDAESDPRLRPWLPDGGLAFAAREVSRRLERTPISVTLKGDSASKSVTVVLGVEDFRRDFLTLSDPALLLAIYHERYEDWASEVLARRRSHDSEEILIYWSIDSSLGVTRAREYLLRNDPATQFLGEWNFDPYIASAGIWPSDDVGDEFRAEVVNRVPILFVQGDWDVWTPMENLLQVTPYFPNSRTLLVEHGTHAAYAEVRLLLPDTTAVIMDFLRSGRTENLPARAKVAAREWKLPNFLAPARRP
jgi:pimeloyl-ACP methyl ester carboxylesterase